MFHLDQISRNPRELKAIIGMNLAEFQSLLPIFSQLLDQSAKRSGRQRAPGGGRKGVLDTPAKKLFFILLYLKVYPTFDLLGALFSKPRGRSCEAVHQLLPLLEKTLGRKLELPARQVSSMEEFRRLFPAVKDVMIDGMERPIHRPSQPKSQRRHYSGKKKSHRRKHIVMADSSRRVLVLTPAKPGRRHDKNLIDRSHLIRAIPPEIGVVADTGFQGIRHPNLFIPKKGSKKRPLSAEQKEENRSISSQRIVVEHAIGGTKRFGAMAQILRNRLGHLDDRISAICAGLWNHHLTMAAFAQG